MLQSSIKLSLDRIDSSFDSRLLVAQCLVQSRVGRGQLVEVLLVRPGPVVQIRDLGQEIILPILTLLLNLDHGSVRVHHLDARPHPGYLMCIQVRMRRVRLMPWYPQTHLCGIHGRRRRAAGGSQGDGT
jgi:hypothetical protein